MTQFIPRNNEKVAEVEAKLAGNIFKDVKTFVEYYNSGMINKGNDETKELVKEITEAFKDVKERKGSLGFVSEAEIILEETIADLGPWLIIAKLKREVTDAVAAKQLSQTGEVLVSHSGLTFVKKVKRNPATNEEVVAISSLDGEKLFAKNDNLNKIESLAKDEFENDGEKYYVIDVEDVLLADLDFVKQLQAIVS